MIYKLTSINTVIAKIVRDLGLGTEEIPWQDFIEWMSEGLAHIGAFSQFEKKCVPIPIVNYHGVLPCDFYKLASVSSQRQIHAPLCLETQAEIEKYLHNLFQIRHDIPLYYWPQLTIGTSALAKVTGEKYYNRESEQSTIVTSSGFHINNNIINVGFECGFISIEYLAFPLDCDGYPLVPDDVSFFDALFWKVVYHLSIRGYLFKNTQLNDIQFTRSMWVRYCGQARADANMPDPIQAEQWKNNFLKLVPNYYPENNNYKSIYNQQRLNLDGRN